jgi:hypothetical protein
MSTIDADGNVIVSFRLTRKETQHLYYLANKAAILERTHAYYDEHREIQQKKSKEWAENHPGWRASYSRKRLYNLSEEDYQHLLTIQQGRCAICRKTPEEAKQRRNLHVEHNHVTGKVRGLACSNCNGRIAWYEQHTDVIALYLKES